LQFHYQVTSVRIEACHAYFKRVLVAGNFILAGAFVYEANKKAFFRQK
jgi:hypothetical protein